MKHEWNRFRQDMRAIFGLNSFGQAPLRERAILAYTNYKLPNSEQIFFKIGKLAWSEAYIEIQEDGYLGDITWSESIINDDFTRFDNTLYIVAFFGKHPIGFISGRIEPDGYHSHVSNLVIIKRFQGLGIGRHLFTLFAKVLIQEGAKIVDLEVRVTNEAAKTLYQKLGFYDFRYYHDYYFSDGADALGMRLNLSDYQRQEQVHDA